MRENKISRRHMSKVHCVLYSGYKVCILLFLEQRMTGHVLPPSEWARNDIRGLLIAFITALN